MPNGNVGLARELVSEESNSEHRIKKGIGFLDAILLSIGFTTSNMQHLITPVAEGGLGITLASEAAVVTSLVTVSVSTILIAGLISYYVFKLIDKDGQDAFELAQKQQELEEQEIAFFSRLIYLRHLMSSKGHAGNLALQEIFKTKLHLNSHAVQKLSNIVESIYQEEKSFPRIMYRRNSNEESEEKVIERFFHERLDKYAEVIQQGLELFYTKPEPVSTSLKPEVAGAFTGFISFIGMSSGFIGTYYSVVSLAISFAAVNLAIPIIGWGILAGSLLFGLAVGLIVRNCTAKSMRREHAMNQIHGKEITLNANFSKVHEIELMLLNNRLEENKSVLSTPPKKKPLTRAHSWSGTMFNRNECKDFTLDEPFRRFIIR